MTEIFQHELSWFYYGIITGDTEPSVVKLLVSQGSRKTNILFTKLFRVFGVVQMTQPSLVW